MERYQNSRLNKNFKVLYIMITLQCSYIKKLFNDNFH